MQTVACRETRTGILPLRLGHLQYVEAGVCSPLDASLSDLKA